MDRGARLRVEGGDLCRGRIGLRLRARDVLLGSHAGRGSRARELLGVALQRQVRARERDLPLQAAQLDVLARDLSAQRHQRVAATFDGGIDVVIRRADDGIAAAEEVDLPARVEADLVEIGRVAAEERARLRVLARAAARVSGAGFELRVVAAGRDIAQRSRLEHACARDLEVEVGVGGALDQLVELCVVERAPPARIGKTGLSAGYLVSLWGAAILAAVAA